MDTKDKTLKDVMPNDLVGCEYDKTRAYAMRNVRVTAEHRHHLDDDMVGWPGTHKNVYFWVELENGSAVGWNENPGRGWSFPVFKLKSEKNIKK